MTTKILWTSFRFFLKRAWHWVKSHWQICLAATILIAVSLASRAKTKALMESLLHLRGSYEKESKGLRETHENEIKNLKLAEKRKSDALKAVEERYALENRNLDKKKKLEIKTIIDENSSNPDEITRRIAEITGFSVFVE